MQDCFDLAKQGLGRTSPNPVVGCIVLDKNGEPVGKGFHKLAGEKHAEVVALEEAGDKAKDGTLIVNLEPCCHQGKTGPCTELIIKSGIKEVVFSNYDPNSLVNGKGEEELKKNGIKVFSKVLEHEGEEVNKFFFKSQKTKLPWVTLKQAQTLDGMVALKSGESKWISSEDSRKESGKLRNIYDAILVSSSTIINDDPMLTTRDVEEGRNPTRIILDKELSSPLKSKVFQDNAQIILATKPGHPKEKIEKLEAMKVKVLEVKVLDNDRLCLKDIFLKLVNLNVLSVLIEAGPKLSGDLISNNLIDEYILFIAPKLFGANNSISSLDLETIQNIEQSYTFRLHDYKIIGHDLMLSLRPNSK